MKNFYVLLILAFVACASPQKNLEKGNFEKAYNGAIEQLEDGKRGKNKEILNRAFKEMLEQNNTDYELRMRKGKVEDWESAFAGRDDLLEQYIKGKRWLSDSFDPKMDAIYSEQAKLAVNIASEYLNLADQAIEVFKSTGDKLAAQDAFDFYTKVSDYDGDNNDVNADMDFAFNAGLIHILVEADSWEFGYEWDIDRRFKNIEKESKGFYQVYYKELINNPDCKIEIDFNRLDHTQNQRTETQDFSKQIQDGYQTVRDTSGNTIREPVYIEVKGSVATTYETHNYFWEVRAKADRLSNYCDFRSKNFNSSSQVERKFYNLQGDRRAIPSSFSDGEDKNIRYNEDDIIDDLIDDLYYKIQRHFF